MADITGKSFIATLLSTTGQHVFPIGYLRDGSIAGDGWLIQDDRAPEGTPLQFDFIKVADTRHYYTISAAPGSSYAGAKLGISRNGYLGFYKVADVSDCWKIELEGNQAHPDVFEFLLRDHRGYRVGSLPETQGGFWTSFKPADKSRTVRFLNVEAGDIVHFQGHIVREL